MTNSAGGFLSKTIIMEIISIERENPEVYTVTLSPNWFEKLFGRKEKIIKVKRDITSRYLFGGNVYILKNGNELGAGSKIGQAIDKWKKSW